MALALREDDCLLIVDVQRDFCPGGALAVPGGDLVVPVINRWIESASEASSTIAASRDWHPPDHSSFADRGGTWPAHCVQDTPGADFHPDLALPEDALVVTKGAWRDRDAYSAFDGTDLGNRLRRRGIRRVFAGGLALDYCVRATVLDALSEGFDTHVIADAVRPVEVTPGDGARALDEMLGAGAVLEDEVWTA